MSWRNPATLEDGPFSRALIIGVSASDQNRLLFEDRLANAIASGETYAEPSSKRLPQKEMLSRDQIVDVVRTEKFDTVIVTRLIGVERDEVFSPGRTVSYYQHYSNSFAVVHTPGHLVTKTVVRLEINAYSVATGQIVWSGASETMDPKSKLDAIDSIAKSVAKELRAKSIMK